MLRIIHARGVTLATPDHLVFLADGRAVAAAVVCAGDVLAGGGEVASVAQGAAIEVYAPLTANGTIVTDLTQMV